MQAPPDDLNSRTREMPDDRGDRSSRTRNMQAEPDDRRPTRRRSGGFPLRSLLIAAILLVLGLLLYFLLADSGEDAIAPVLKPMSTKLPAPTQSLPVRPASRQLPPALDIPEKEPVAQIEAVEETPAPVVLPPPTLAESDAVMREELAKATESTLLRSALQSSSLVDRVTGVIDGLNRGVVMRKVLPAAPPSKAFSVEQKDGSDYIHPKSYARYDDYADAILALETDTLVSSFHRFRPLLESAYRELGYGEGEFDNAVIRGLDRILATPEISGPIRLERPAVMYTFADPELEALLPLQKQLLRMGPDNVWKIKQQAQALRDQLLQ